MSLNQDLVQRGSDEGSFSQDDVIIKKEPFPDHETCDRDGLSSEEEIDIKEEPFPYHETCSVTINLYNTSQGNADQCKSEISNTSICENKFALASSTVEYPGCPARDSVVDKDGCPPSDCVAGSNAEIGYEVKREVTDDCSYEEQLPSHSEDSGYPDQRIRANHFQKKKKTSGKYGTYSREQGEKTYCLRSRIAKNTWTLNSKTLQFKCSNCPLIFQSQSELKSHTVVHSSLRCICAMCKRPFMHEMELYDHIISAHATKPPFNCHLCPESFELSEVLRDHFVSHKALKCYVCIKCGATYTSSSGLSRHKERPCNIASAENGVTVHMKSQKAQKMFGCLQCDSKFKQKQNLRNHILTNHSESAERSFCCTFCEKRFVLKCGLTAHTKTHTVAPTIQCKFCPMKFRKNGYLTKHMVTHSKEHKFSCNLCSKAFKRRSDLTVHLATALHSTVRRFTCLECSKTFTSRDTLKSHLLTHSDVRPFGCDQCSATFKSISTRRQHMLVHSNVISDKPQNHKAHNDSHNGVVREMHSCLQCDRKFTTKQHMQRHAASMHSAERQFGCTLCERRFASQNILIDHVKYHAMAFTCHNCLKSFKTKQALKSHMYSHSTERAFGCKQCPASYKQKSGLWQHMLTHSDTKRFTCALCDEGFARKERLKVHLDRHNGVV